MPPCITTKGAVMTTANAVRDRDGHDDHGHELVEVFIDGHGKRIPRGTYTTAELKKALGVDASLDLDVIDEHGAFRTLTDTDHPVVKQGEKFISHVKKGASS